MSDFNNFENSLNERTGNQFYYRQTLSLSLTHTLTYTHTLYLSLVLSFGWKEFLHQQMRKDLQTRRRGPCVESVSKREGENEWERQYAKPIQKNGVAGICVVRQQPRERNVRAIMDLLCWWDTHLFYIHYFPLFYQSSLKKIPRIDKLRHKSTDFLSNSCWMIILYFYTKWRTPQC